MRHISKLAGIAAIAIATAVGGSAVTANAAGPTSHQKVDGTIVVGDDTCSWTNGSTSANPPSALTVDRTTVNSPGGNLSCSGDISATLNKDPAFSFDDANATATSDLIDITGRQGFISCRYQATNVQWDREGTTRQYTNKPFTANLVSGGFLCPATVDADPGEASMLFH